MQVTKRQDANYTEREKEEEDEAQVNPEVGVGTEDWHARTSERSDLENGNRMGWRRLESGSVRLKVQKKNPKQNKTKKRSHPIQSSPVSLMQLQSLPGLVEEDVS